MAQETSDFRCEGLSPSLRLLIPTFSLPYAPRSVTLPLQRIWNALLPLADFTEDVNAIFITITFLANPEWLGTHNPDEGVSSVCAMPPGTLQGIFPL